MNTANETRAQYIAQFKADRADLVQRLEGLQGVLLGNGYVVRCGGLTLGFDVDPTTKVATNPRTVPLRMAPMYTRGDAQTLAAATCNGNGEQAQAVHIRDALAQAIAELDRIVASLEQ